MPKYANMLNMCTYMYKCIHDYTNMYISIKYAYLTVLESVHLFHESGGHSRLAEGGHATEASIRRDAHDALKKTD